MSRPIAEIESEARQLAARDRAKLIRRLLTTLESENEGDLQDALTPLPASFVMKVLRPQRSVSHHRDLGTAQA